MIITLVALLVIISLIVLIGMRINISLYKHGGLHPEMQHIYMEKNRNERLHDVIFQHN